MAEFLVKKRESHDIIVEILQTALEGVSKTHIMNQANLNYGQNEKYLKALENAGFITENSGVWKTTKEGLQAIEACKLCRRLTKVS